MQPHLLRDFPDPEWCVGGEEHVQYAGAAAAEQSSVLRPEELLCFHVPILYENSRNYSTGLPAGGPQGLRTA